MINVRSGMASEFGSLHVNRLLKGRAYDEEI
jgi:hypothetical protein